jgi:hypothetical protein
VIRDSPSCSRHRNRTAGRPPEDHRAFKQWSSADQAVPQAPFGSADVDQKVEVILRISGVIADRRRDLRDTSSAR